MKKEKLEAYAMKRVAHLPNAETRFFEKLQTNRDVALSVSLAETEDIATRTSDDV